MIARVLLFGRLRDAAGFGAREIVLDGPMALNDVLSKLGDDNAMLSEALAASSIRIAVNAVIVGAGDAPLIHPGDEVALMPPFSGG